MISCSQWFDLCDKLNVICILVLDFIILEVKILLLRLQKDAGFVKKLNQKPISWNPWMNSKKPFDFDKKQCMNYQKP